MAIIFSNTPANSNPDPFVSFGHKLVDVNSRMPFGSFEQSLDYFRQTGALDEQPRAFGFIPPMRTKLGDGK